MHIPLTPHPAHTQPTPFSLRGSQARLASTGASLLLQSDHDESNERACHAHADCHRSHWCEKRRGEARSGAANGGGGGVGACAPEACSGFYLAVPGAAPEAFFGSLFATFDDLKGRGDAREGEQPALNYLLPRLLLPRAPPPAPPPAGSSPAASPAPFFHLLPRDLYPNGAAYFARGMRPPPDCRGKRPPPFIVHNNWMRGAEPKQARFEAHGMWLLPQPDAAAIGEGGVEASAGAGVGPEVLAGVGKCVDTVLPDFGRASAGPGGT